MSSESGEEHKDDSTEEKKEEKHKMTKKPHALPSRDNQPGKAAGHLAVISADNIISIRCYKCRHLLHQYATCSGGPFNGVGAGGTPSSYWHCKLCCNFNLCDTCQREEFPCQEVSKFRVNHSTTRPAGNPLYPPCTLHRMFQKRSRCLYLIFPKYFEFLLFLSAIWRDEGEPSCIYPINLGPEVFTHNNLQCACMVRYLHPDAGEFRHFCATVIGDSDIGFNQSFQNFIAKGPFKYMGEPTYDCLLVGTCAGSESLKARLGDVVAIQQAFKWDRGSLQLFGDEGPRASVKIDISKLLSAEGTMGGYFGETEGITLSSNFLTYVDPRTLATHLFDYKTHYRYCPRIVAEMETYDFFKICRRNAGRGRVGEYGCLRVISDIPCPFPNLKLIKRSITSSLDTILPDWTNDMPQAARALKCLQDSARILRLGRKTLLMDELWTHVKNLQTCVSEGLDAPAHRPDNGKWENFAKGNFATELRSQVKDALGLKEEWEGEDAV